MREEPFPYIKLTNLVLKPFSIIETVSLKEKAKIMEKEDKAVFKAIRTIKKRGKKMSTVILMQPPVQTIKALIKSAGTNIGSVYFIKKENNELRKMCYRLHVKNPKTSKFKTEKNSKASKKKQKTDKSHNLITVYDVNKVIRDSLGNKIGRGAWRCIPLDKVTRIVADGVEYQIHQDSLIHDCDFDLE